MTQNPAPLNPSKVKAGDTVTLTRGKAVVTDEVRQVRPYVPGDTAFGIVLTQDPGTVYRWIGGTPEHWTLTDHQPAPDVDDLVDVTYDDLMSSASWRSREDIEAVIRALLPHLGIEAS